MPRMKTRRPFLTTLHQRQRLALWALAVLQWIAAVLFGGRRIAVRHLRQRCERASLEGLTRLVINLMIVRARELAGQRPRKRRFWRHGRDLRPCHLIRSLLGSKLRLVLRSKDLASRIAALIAALRDLDRHARHLAQRMRRRLTRLWAIAPAPSPATCLEQMLTSAPAFADSS
jgi:hypothetical protein